MQAVTHFYNLQYRHGLVFGGWNLSQRFVQIGVELLSERVDRFRRVSFKSIPKLLRHHLNTVEQRLHIACLFRTADGAIQSIESGKYIT